MALEGQAVQGKGQAATRILALAPHALPPPGAQPGCLPAVFLCPTAILPCLVALIQRCPVRHALGSGVPSPPTCPHGQALPNNPHAQSMLSP